LEWECGWERDGDRDREWDGDRDREWDGDRDREWDGDRDRESDGDRDREWDGDRDREWDGDRDREWPWGSSPGTVAAFADAHASARQPLFAWFAEVGKARWSGPADIKVRYRSASFLAGDRVVFNIKGSEYRAVVAIKYEFFAVYIRFIGTHAEYDKIDAATI